MYQNINGKRDTINDRNGTIYYDMKISFHENRLPRPRGQRQRGQPLPSLQVFPNEPYQKNRVHLQMRDNRYNLPITNTRVYHIAIDAYDPSSGLKFLHRDVQESPLMSPSTIRNDFRKVKSF